MHTYTLSSVVHTTTYIGTDFFFFLLCFFLFLSFLEVRHLLSGSESSILKIFKRKKERKKKKEVIRTLLFYDVLKRKNELNSAIDFLFLLFQDLTIINAYLKHLEALSSLRESHIRNLCKTIRYENHDTHHVLFRFVFAFLIFLLFVCFLFIHFFFLHTE